MQVAAAFPTFSDAYAFAAKIAMDPQWQKRLVTVFEWPIPSFFTPISQVVAHDHALIFFMIASDQEPLLRTEIRNAGGVVSFVGPYQGVRTSPLLSDYTWNHTTLWAMKYNASYTYLQCGFSPADAPQQFAKLRERFGDEFLFHIEFMKTGDGSVIPGAIPVVHFTTEERLTDMIDFCRSIGVSVANPHVNYVEGGGRYRPDHIQLLAKKKYDPRGLLNPGKMMSFVKENPSQ
jgi:FAD/FMN-containing dehydrogenase